MSEKQEATNRYVFVTSYVPVRYPFAILLLPPATGWRLIGSTECADLEPWRFRAAHWLRNYFRSAKLSALLPWLAGSILSISNAVRPGVAGCLGNGSMLARGGSLMERLWIREVRRAARRASAPFARQVALGCGAAAVGTIVASLLPLQLDGAVAQAVWAAVWAVAGYVAIWTGLFMVTCGGIDLADFGTRTGLRDTMTPIRAVLFS